MAEYIERGAVEKFIENGLNNPDRNKAFGHDAIEIMAEVHYMPAADVAPVVHAEWVVCGDGDNVPWMCSHCGKTTAHKYKVIYGKYCPHCGAKMDGGNENV